MKILKILLSIVLGIGLIVGGMELIKNCTDIRVVDPIQDDAKYTELKKEIESDWKDVSQWNLNLYNGEIKNVEDWYSTNDISESNLEKLKLEINSYALIAIDKTLPGLMKAAKWDADKINIEMAGIDSVSQIPALAEKEEVVKAKAVYNLYYKITKWIDTTNRYTAGHYYNGYKERWTPFVNYIKQTESEISQLKAEKYYKEFLANKLDKPLSEAVKHVEGLQQGYYNLVASSIINHFAIQDWDKYPNPMEVFSKEKEDLNRVAKRLREEDLKAYSPVKEHIYKFNKSQPDEPTKK